MTEAAEILGEQGAQSVDQVWRDVLVAGSNVFCATDDVGGTSATRTNVDGLYNQVFNDKLQRALKRQNAKFFNKMVNASTGVGTVPIRQSYWAITHPDVEYSLDNATLNPSYRAVHEYGHQQEVMKQFEIGANKNIRFCTTTLQRLLGRRRQRGGSGHQASAPKTYS